MSSPFRALLLDFGGVVLRTPFELVPAFEERHGLPPGTVDWSGPFDLENDLDFARVLTGDLREREYWAGRAKALAEILGWGDPRAAMHELFELDEAALIRPEWGELIPKVQAAGIRVAVLTNDLGHFHPQSWIDRIAMLRQIDVMIDLSETDYLKPHPKAFEEALRRLDVGAKEVLFVDDQPFNRTGAEEVGIPHVHFDATDSRASVAVVRELLGLAKTDNQVSPR